jgi:hypothetical protein
MLRPVLDLEVLDTLPGEESMPVQDMEPAYAGERRPRVRPGALWCIAVTCVGVCVCVCAALSWRAWVTMRPLRRRPFA